jgi:hypothetical protein
LAAGNKAAIRLASFECLLYFIQGLLTPSNEGIDQHIQWFAAAINLKPFATAVQAETNTNVYLKRTPAEGV